MRVTFIFQISFFLLLMACSSSRKSANNEDMNVIRAEYELWNQAPQPGSDIPEKGLDLRITLEGWPKGHVPEYLIYNNLRSFNVSIAKRSANQIVITGRIIQSSGLVGETSASINLSNRLVFTDADGTERYIKIQQWEKAEEIKSS